MVSTVIATPSRSGVCGSPAARKAPLSMKNIIMPNMPMNIARRNGSASARTVGRGVHERQQRRRGEVADGRQEHRAAGGREERLIDRG